MTKTLLKFNLSIKIEIFFNFLPLFSITLLFKKQTKAVDLSKLSFNPISLPN